MRRFFNGTGKPGFPAAAVFALAGTALFLVARANYLLFHALVELACVVVAGLIFTISWLTKEHEGNVFPVTLGVGYLFSGFFDLLHILAYKGMGVFISTGANPATQLWIAGRYWEASILAAAPLVRSGRAWAFFTAGGTVYASFVLTGIFRWRNFPDCYLEGKGLTVFKIASEYAIILLLLTALLTLRRGRTRLPPVLVRYLPFSILCTIVSEFCFTLYVNVTDVANFTGHLAKLAGYAVLFSGIAAHCIKEPLNNLYRTLYQDRLRLQNLAITDPLTGLLNRRGVELVLKDSWRQARETGLSKSPSFALIMVDIDYFKAVNDNHGHKAGDLVLRELAGAIAGSVRDGLDLAARYGGEEFLLAVANAGTEMACAVAERLRKKVEGHEFALPSGKVIRITISAGVAAGEKYGSPEEALECADRALYRAKEKGRNRTEVA